MEAVIIGESEKHDMSTINIFQLMPIPISASIFIYPLQSCVGNHIHYYKNGERH